MTVFAVIETLGDEVAGGDVYAFDLYHTFHSALAECIARIDALKDDAESDGKKFSVSQKIVDGEYANFTCCTEHDTNSFDTEVINFFVRMKIVRD